MTESLLLKRIQLEAPLHHARLLRNVVGVGYVGNVQVITQYQTVTLQPGDILIKNGRRLHAGLCVGSSDLIGWKSIAVQEKHVGRRFALFTAIEGKTAHTRTTDEQFSFRNAVRAAGGIAVITKTVEDAVGGLCEFD